MAFGWRARVSGLALAWVAASALAANVAISPTVVELQPARMARALQLRNGGDAPLAMEVTVKRWRMAGDGRWQFEEVVGASDLMVHPLSFQVAPGKTQTVRIGLVRTPQAGPEQAWRVFLRELPGPAREEQGAVLGVVAQFSVPVFVSDGRGKAAPALRSEGIAHGRWRYRLGTGDHGHLVPVKATLKLFDAQGRLLSTQEVDHGYVLAGAELPVEVLLDGNACNAAKRYELVVAPPAGVLAGELPATARTCGH